MVDPRLIAAVGDLIERHVTGGRIPVIAVAGAQGSGKSTLAQAAASAFGAVALSLDDVYLGRAERAALAARVHPLFATRGPPGTHDLAVLHAVLDALTQGADAVALPAFDKLADDRAPPRPWSGRPRAVLIEGWCLGATPQSPEALIAPVNALEREHDPDARWRAAVNAALASDYAALFARFDALMFLKAPGFEPVLDWRCEQEAGLLGLPLAALPPARRDVLARFIQHFERLTRQMLAGGVQADVVVRLTPDRRVAAL